MQRAAHPLRGSGTNPVTSLATKPRPSDVLFLIGGDPRLAASNSQSGAYMKPEHSHLVATLPPNICWSAALLHLKMCRGGGGVWYLRVRAWKRFCVLNLRNHLFNELSLCSPVDRCLQEVPFGEQGLRPPVLNSLVFLSCWFVIFFFFKCA